MLLLLSRPGPHPSQRSAVPATTTLRSAPFLCRYVAYCWEQQQQRVASVEGFKLSFLIPPSSSSFFFTSL